MGSLGTWSSGVTAWADAPLEDDPAAVLAEIEEGCKPLFDALSAFYSRLCRVPGLPCRVHDLVGGDAQEAVNALSTALIDASNLAYDWQHGKEA